MSQETEAALAAAAEQLREKDEAMEGLQAENKRLSAELKKCTRCNRLTHVVGAWTGECERCQIDECESRVAIIETALETEKTMHAAWEKRAYEAEAENKRLGERLAAAERLLRSVDQVYVGDVKLHRTSVGKIHLSRLVPARETLEHQSTDTKNLIDAYLAAVAANWLPTERKDG